MRKTIRRIKFIIISALIIVITTSIFSCKNNQNKDSVFYTPEVFLSLSNFTLTTNKTPTNTIQYSQEKNQIIFHSSTLTQEIKALYCIFSTTYSQKFSQGEWEEVSQTDIPVYLRAIRDSSGLVYTRTQIQYFSKFSTNIYSIDAEHLFMSAFRENYEHFFGTSYSESEFLEDFHSSAPALFGSFDDYEILLDCSKDGHMTLSITKKSSSTEKGFKNVYDYFNIDKTKITFPTPPNSAARTIQ